jgi:ubiquinone/menaquinone biosynthesis C-methylase UbiE
MTQISKTFDDRTRKVLKIASKYRDVQKFLDIGCGAVDFTILLNNALLAREVYDIDISIETCIHARAKGIQAFCLDLDEVKTLPFENEYFDAIFCGEVIEYLTDPDNRLNEIHRILKRGGIAVMTTPNLGACYNRIILLFGFQPHLFPASPRNTEVGQFFYYNKLT